MFYKKRGKEIDLLANKTGFSLVEVLIAITILVLIAVPLAVNMITSSQFNSKAKQTAASSNLATSILDTMQAIGLGDILTDVNGYDTDEYGTKLDYTLTGNTLSHYDIGKKAEVIVNGNRYVPVTKRGSTKVDENGETVIVPDSELTSSILAKTAGDVTKTYFTGRGKSNYAFVLTGVENDEINVDVLVTVEPKQTFSMVNINSLSQTDIMYVKQQENMDQTVVNEFKQANDVYVALNGTTDAISQPASWFFDNMQRTITITIQQDTFTDSTTIIIDAKYTVQCEYLNEGDKEIVKNLGSFSTNSTAEFARGVYLYYYPLEDANGAARDHFVINNKNELNVPIYLLAMYDSNNTNNSNESGDQNNGETNGQTGNFDISKYHPTLLVNELSNAVYDKVARTIICSNIDDLLWTKTLSPANDRTLAVKTISNLSDQQTMYAVNVKVYNHRNDSYDTSGIFLPRDNDLLIETSGTFLDISEKIDVESDKTTGVTNLSKGARVIISQTLIYNGNEQDGVIGENVVLTGQASGINAGTYTAYATPSAGYAWNDGTTTTKTISWKINRATIEIPTATNRNYVADIVCGIKDMDRGDNKFVNFGGVTEAFDAGSYTAYATPDENHMWADNTYQTKSIKWNIYALPVTINWVAHTWSYDGQTHFAECEVVGLLAADVGNCDPIFENNYIKNVGYKTATITGLTNKNYKLHPNAETSHEIRVNPTSAASFTLTDTSELVYDGKVKSVASKSNGVIFEDDSTGKDAGTYDCIAKLQDGYDWSEEIKKQYGIGENEVVNSIPLAWTIEKRTVSLNWGKTHWDYDGNRHMVTCNVGNVILGDNVTADLSYYDTESGLYQNAGNLGIQNVKESGKIVVTATGLSNTNDNYQLPENTSVTLTMSGAPYAIYETYKFNYNGEAHTGVGGQYVIPITDGASGTDVKIGVDENGKRVVVPYTCKIQPSENYTWAKGTMVDGIDLCGSTTPIEVEWWIYPIEDATCSHSDFSFSGKSITGVWGEYFDHSKITNDTEIYRIWGEKYDDNKNGVLEEDEWDGSLNDVLEATALGQYGVAVTPQQNHAWKAEGSSTWNVETKIIAWEIAPSTSNIPYAVDEEIVYDGQIHYPTIPDDVLSPRYTMKSTYNTDVTDLSAIHAGTYTVVCSLINQSGGVTWSDGTTEDKTFTWTIHPKEIELMIDKNTWEYDGENHAGTATISTELCDRVISVDEEGNVTTERDVCTLIYSDNVHKDADTYEFKVIGVVNGENNRYNDYCLKGGDVTGNMTITPKPVTIKWGQTEFDYDGTEKRLNPKLNNAIDDNYILITTENNGQTEAGSYPVTVKSVNTKNYQLPESEEERTKDLVIKPGLAFVDISQSPIQYDGQNHTIQMQNVTYTSDSKISATDAGTYRIIATPKKNYAWEDGTDGQKEFIWLIQDGGIYYVGVSNEYLDVDGYKNQPNVQMYTGGTFPSTVSDGDVYVDGDYEYRYNKYYCFTDDNVYKWVADPTQNGWGVRVLDNTKTSYDTILENVNGKPVTSMASTFSGCSSLTTAPATPSAVKNMSRTFESCESLITAPAIPEGVTNINRTFDYCTALAGKISIPCSFIHSNCTYTNCPATIAYYHVNGCDGRVCIDGEM